jgi:RluA family pseudouridine synthase
MRTWSHVVHRGEDGLRLDAVLAARLPAALGLSLSRSQIRRLVMGGAVRVDRVALRRPGMLLSAGERLDARVDPAKLTPRAEPAAPRLSAVDVLYEDDDLIAIAKPAGVATHASADPRRPDVVSLLRAWLSAGHGPDARPYVGVHQRLDRETSGVVLFTRSERANRSLARAFAGHDVVKVYHALTVPARGRVPARWSIEMPLGPSGRGAASRMTAMPGGLPARTDVRLIERRAHALLLEARPRTGRRHQIRAQLADAGLPILGDTRYGAPSTGASGAPRLMLHCARLEIRHPVTDAALAIDCPWPADFRAAFEEWPR